MVERLTARKCSVRDLNVGEYVVKTSEPSQLVTPTGPASRINLIAAVVGKPGKAALLLDDGTGTIETRAFDDQKLFDNILLGDILLLIGRPRQHRGQTYVVAEIAKRLGSPKWLELRKVELARMEKEGSGQERPAVVAPKIPIKEKKEKQPKKSENVGKTVKKDEETLTLTSDKVLALIKELDDGAGAPVEQIIAKLGPGAETAVTDLMAEGEIFEIKPGRVKVLE